MKSLDSLVGWFYWIFAMIYTFKVWGFGWGIVSIFLPIFPLIDGAKYIVHLVS